MSGGFAKSPRRARVRAGHRTRVLLLAGFATVAHGANLLAASATWTFGGSGTWSVAGNWTSGGPPNAGGQLAEFAAYATSPPLGGITVSLTSSVTVGSIVFNTTSSVPITLEMIGGINLQVGPASNADGIAVDTNAADVTINGVTQSYRFGTNTVGNLNVGANRTLTMNTPLAGSSATRDPRKVGLGTLVVGVSGTGNASNAVRMFQMIDGYLAFGMDGSLSGSTTTINFNGGTLAASGSARSISNNFALTGNINFNGSQDLTLTGAGTLTGNRAIGVHSTTAGLKLDGNLSGAGFGLTKQGPGTLRLSGSNTYTGTTTVDAGKLVVNGTHSGAGAYTVNTGGTLGGSGTISSGVTVNSSGTLSPGGSIGVLTVGSLAMAAGSTYTVEVDGTDLAEAADRVNITGMGPLTLGDGSSFPSLQFVFTPAASKQFLAGKAFVIVQNTDSAATLPSGARFAGDEPVAGVQDFVDGLLEYSVYYGVYSGSVFGGGVVADNNDIVVLFTEVPEPTLLAPLATAMLLLRRRRDRVAPTRIIRSTPAGSGTGVKM